MVDISSLGEMAGLLQNLPEIMFWAQIAIYIFLIFFFGSIAMKGYKGYLQGKLHLLLRIGSGFVCLVTGIGLSSFLPFVSENMILKISQIDLIIGGAISSIVLLVSLYIITLRFPRSAVIKKNIEALEKKLAKTKDRPPSPRKIDPFMIIGAVIIIVFLIISLMNFRGFPNMTEDMLSQLGITPEELSQMGDLLGGTGGSGGKVEIPDQLMENLPIEIVGDKEGKKEISIACLQAITNIGLKDISELTGTTQPYSDDTVKNMIESGSGRIVKETYGIYQMVSITEKGQTVIAAFMTDDTFCMALPTEFCSCFNLT